MFRSCCVATVLAIVGLIAPTPLVAQPPADLLLPAQASAATRRDVPARRARPVRVNLQALDALTLRLHLFDDVRPTLTRRKLDRPRADALVWVGDDEYGSQAVLTVSRGALTGTVFADNRTFEIALDADGQYSVTELDSAAFPTDDPVVEALEDPEALAADQATSTVQSPASGDTSGGTRMDVMIVWTPKAEAAAGGRAAMESLALNAVATSNLIYTNSGVQAQLRLVYAAPISFVETASNISGDLSALRSTTDGAMDAVHSIRTQYGADLVSLVGDGYRSAGSCGIGGLMTTVSTAFASHAFNVVDRSCAVGNLSYAHEVGHNQGLHHDPANAGSASSTPYAFGYQDPSGYFRTVLSYGSATRVAHLSAPLVFYNGRATGTSSQDNARALNTNAATVAAFRSAPSCTYAVSDTSLTFRATGGRKTEYVTTPSGCSWTTSSGASWVTVSAGKTGSGSFTVTAAVNASTARSTTIKVAGRSITIYQKKR